MKSMTFYLSTLVLLTSMHLDAQNSANKPAPDKFPALPYAYNALEPYIDAATMEVHYSKHHQGYYDKFISAIKGTSIEKENLGAIFGQISKLDVAVRNNGGGYYNHVLFWENMTPAPIAVPEKLKLAIEKQFGSVDNFKDQFTKASLSLFGSGWTWLIVDQKKNLKIITTPNQDNPLMDIAAVKGTPLLTLDIWEHAYYLKYQNKRPAYVEAFWKVVNWQVVNERFISAQKQVL